MGILNVTPDSFSDGGLYHQMDKALKQAEKMILEGVDIIDIGGESTRPNAKTIPVDEELNRVIPIIEKIRQELDIPISVDTKKTAVMAAAIQAGVSMVNDITALADPKAQQLLAEKSLPVCLMHMQGTPETMQDNPTYQNIMQELIYFFQQRIENCVKNGIKRENIIIDPGFGFGKTLQDNLTILKNIDQLLVFNLPLLVGISRKSMIGGILNNEPKDRMIGSISAAIYATLKGVHILRVHDVQETIEAVKVIQAIDHV